MESAGLSLPLCTLSKTRKTSPILSLLPLNSTSAFHKPIAASSSSAPNLISLSLSFNLQKSPLSFHFSNISLSNPSEMSLNAHRFASISSSADALAYGGGAGGMSAGNGGGGGGGGEGGAPEAAPMAGESEKETSHDLPRDVIILQVEGMSCGGCAAKVKRILENQPQVSSASVNHATGTAVVWAQPEVKDIENWQKQIGEALAKHLTSCGFKSSLQGREYSIEEVPS